MGVLRIGKQHLVAVAFAVVSVVWGSTYLGIRVALTGFPPFFLSAARFVVAGVVIAAFARWRGEPSPTAREWGSAILTGILFFVVGNGLVNVAEKSVSSGLVSVLVATMPLWVTVFGRLFGVRVSRAELVGVLLGLLGVVVLNLGGELRASPAGAVCGLLAAMGWGLGAVTSGRLPLPKGLMRTAAQMIGGGAATWGVSLIAGEHFTGAPSPRAWLALIYLFGVGSIVGFSAYTFLLAHARPAVAASYAYVNPVIAVFLGVVLLGERVEGTSLAGAAIVLAAVVLVGRARSSAQSRESASRSRSTVDVASSSDSKRSTTVDVASSSDSKRCTTPESTTTT
jgi:drug/metabolite transporter (DMT)-like permease